jgi:hypothetical protein
MVPPGCKYSEALVSLLDTSRYKTNRRAYAYTCIAISMLPGCQPDLLHQSRCCQLPAISATKTSGPAIGKSPSTTSILLLLPLPSMSSQQTKICDKLTIDNYYLSACFRLFFSCRQPPTRQAQPITIYVSKHLQRTMYCRACRRLSAFCCCCRRCCCCLLLELCCCGSGVETKRCHSKAYLLPYKCACTKAA